MNLRLEPGSVFFSDAGRHFFTREAIGDCATRAIVSLFAHPVKSRCGVTLALNEPSPIANPPSYSDVRHRIIDEKQCAFAHPEADKDAFRACGYDDRWTATHEKASKWIVGRVVNHYAVLQWRFYSVAGITDARCEFRNVAKALKDFSLLMFNENHVVACRDGVLIDDIDTADYTAESILIPEVAIAAVVNALMTI